MSGGASSDMPKGWVDQLYHDMKALGRAKLAPPTEDWKQHGRAKRVLSEDQKRNMHAGLRRYWERRRGGGD